MSAIPEPLPQREEKGTRKDESDKKLGSGKLEKKKDATTKEKKEKPGGKNKPVEEWLMQRAPEDQVIEGEKQKRKGGKGVSEGSSGLKLYKRIRQWGRKKQRSRLKAKKKKEKRRRGRGAFGRKQEEKRH